MARAGREVTGEEVAAGDVEMIVMIVVEEMTDAEVEVEDEADPAAGAVEEEEEEGAGVHHTEACLEDEEDPGASQDPDHEDCLCSL